MFDKVVKSTVPGQVIEQIKELLVKGELKRGDRLPPERQLADMLGVSRPSLREALRALEYAGMLETRVGEGIFVADGDSIMMNNLLMLHLIKQYALEEMIEVRKVLETSNVRFAVLRARDEDLAALKEILEQSRGQIANKAAFIKSDYAFHQATRASGNSILATMLQTMRTMMSDFNSQLLTSQEGRQQVYAHHKKIVEAILNRDEKAAQDAMFLHLENVRPEHEARPHPAKANNPNGARSPAPATMPPCTICHDELGHDAPAYMRPRPHFRVSSCPHYNTVISVHFFVKRILKQPSPPYAYPHRSARRRAVRSNMPCVCKAVSPNRSKPSP